MPDTVFVPGMATAIGSMPHRDAGAAAALVLRCVPELPAAPQLPMRTPLEGFVAQWIRAIDGVRRRSRRLVHAGDTISTRKQTSTRPSMRSRTVACSRSSTPRPRCPSRPAGSRCSVRDRSRSGSRSSRPAADVDVAFAVGAHARASVGQGARGARRVAPSGRGARRLLRRARARALAGRYRAGRA